MGLFEGKTRGGENLEQMEEDEEAIGSRVETEWSRRISDPISLALGKLNTI